MKRNALISVYDKSSLRKICSIFNKYNIGIISTGATAKKIISLGYACKEISNLTKFKEILNGRVKTLNPKIHASILYKRDDHEHEKTFIGTSPRSLNQGRTSKVFLSNIASIDITYENACHINAGIRRNV